jgi:hypothetical protein
MEHYRQDLRKVTWLSWVCKYIMGNIPSYQQYMTVLHNMCQMKLTEQLKISIANILCTGKALAHWSSEIRDVLHMMKPQWGRWSRHHWRSGRRKPQREETEMTYTGVAQDGHWRARVYVGKGASPRGRRREMGSQGWRRMMNVSFKSRPNPQIMKSRPEARVDGAPRGAQLRLQWPGNLRSCI